MALFFFILFFDVFVSALYQGQPATLIPPALSCPSLLQETYTVGPLYPQVLHPRIQATADPHFI